MVRIYFFAGYGRVRRGDGGGVPAMNAAEIQVPPSLGLGLGAGSRVGDLVPHLPRRGANRPAAGSHWVRRLPAPQRAPNVPHPLIDNQVIPSTLNLVIIIQLSTTCPTCQQRLDQAEEEGLLQLPQ